MDGEGEMSAVFSPCRRWRYTLERTVQQSIFAPPHGTMACIGLNPSKAAEGEDENDNTIRKLIGFAGRLGFNRLRMLNLYAWVSTDPKGLAASPDAVGPENNRYLLSGTADAFVVCAWGVNASGLREAEVISMLRAAGRELHAFRLTKHGRPEHPLYLPGDLTPIPYGVPHV